MAKNQYSDDFDDYSASGDIGSEIGQTINDIDHAARKSNDVAKKMGSLRDGNYGNNFGSGDAGSLNFGGEKENFANGSSDHSSTPQNTEKKRENPDTSKGLNADSSPSNGAAGKNAEMQASKEAGKEIGKEAGIEAGKKAGEIAAKETGKSIAKGAAGAATGGVGTVLLEAADLARKAVKSLENAASGGSSKKKSSDINRILIVLAILVIIPTLFISAVTKTVGGTLSQYISDQAYNAAQTKQEIDSKNDTVYENYEGQQNAPKKKSFYDGALKEAGSVFKKLAALLGFGSGEDDDKEGPYDIANAYYEATSRSKAMIDDPILTKARTHGAYGGQIEKDIDIIIEREDYDYELTWGSFDAEADIFEGINYAEFLSVMTENENYNSENAKHEEIEDLFKTTKNVRLLYRLYIEPAEMTAWEAGRATPEYATTWNSTTNSYETDYNTITNQEELDRLIRYGKVTLRRYYLRDLYEIFELDAFAKNYEFEGVSEYMTTQTGQENIEMLDRIEDTMRQYCDVSENANAEELLGPSDRSEYDGEPTDTPIDESNSQYEYTKDESGRKDDTVIYEADETELSNVHGQIGAEIGDITEIAKLVAQRFVNLNPEHPYGYGKAVTGSYGFTTVSLPWGSYNVSPCCASGTVLVAKYFGLKGSTTSATSAVASSSYAGTRVSASSMSQLRVGDIITYGSSHTEIVTKIDGSNVYIAGFGSDTNIKKDAQNGYNKVVSKSNAVASLQFSSSAPAVWRPNDNTFNFSEG